MLNLAISSALTEGRAADPDFRLRAKPGVDGCLLFRQRLAVRGEDASGEGHEILG